MPPVLKAAYKRLRLDLFGGAVEIPGGYEDAIIREIKEESGIEMRDLISLSVEMGYNKDEDLYVLFIGYRCEAVTQSVKLSPEHTKYRWVAKEEFMELDATPYLKDFVSKSMRDN
jgi:nucleoside triphosphatase